MKPWEYETIREASTGTIAGQLCDWTELQEALANNRLSLPGLTSMKAVKEICRLVLAADEVTRLRDRVNELESRLALSVDMRTNCGDL
jgi:hypothetical protein